ncbi:MAG TPA: hypothetical protein VIL88_15935 [Devosia sp.]|jgi:hypothetical protein|uniref:DUF6985 domain-containing protein n=1 Tax=Devosia sp. TaxID=1871048 RepID=UPI002F942123
MVKVAYFDGAELVFDTEEDLDEHKTAAAVEAFLALTAGDRIKDTRHVYAYYKDVHEATDGQDWLDEEMGVPATPEAIWSHVQPGMLGIWHGYGEDESVYVFAECNCDWDVEHGLLLVWRDGKVLNKAGEFDGHPTNANAYGDETLRDVVYHASNPAWSTRLDD